MKLIAKNKKAYFNFQITQTFECGIVLLGDEVKLIRLGMVNLTNSYAVFTIKNELFILNLQINQSSNYTYKVDSKRSKKLLLSKQQIKKFKKLKETERISLVPTRMYWKNNYIKIEVGVGKGKKLYDKRETIKKRDQEREERRIAKKARH